MKKTLYLILSIFILILFALIFCNDLRCFLVSKYEMLAKWLYPINEDRNAELLKILLSSLAGVGVLFGIYVSFWRAKTTEESVRLQSSAIEKQGEQIKLSTKSQIDERFSNSIEHLGSDKEPVLLGGIAELHQIAKENRKDYAEVVFNILCSYIRSSTNVYKKKADDFNHTAIQTIFNYLFKPAIDSEYPYKDFKADLGHSNLLGVDFDNSNLSDSDLSFCLLPSMENVNLKGTTLSSSKFSAVTLKNVDISEAKIFNAYFHLAKLRAVNFENSPETISIHFTDSELKHINFNNSDISNSSFIASYLFQLSFKNSEILTTTFACSTLSMIDFIDNPVLYELDFRASIFDNVSFNSFMSNSLFNGCDSSLNLSQEIDGRLKDRVGKNSDLTSIKYDPILFNHCDTGVLSQNAADEIMNIFNNLSKRK